MASRERKISLSKKQNAGSPVPPKDSTVDVTKTDSPNDAEKKPAKTNKAGILAKKNTQKKKPTIAKVNLKAKAKCRKITKLTAALKKAVRANPAVKKALLKNGVKSTPKKLIPKSKIKTEPLAGDNESDKMKKPSRPSPKNKRKPAAKKVVVKEETIEDVMNDLTSLLKEEDIKQEVEAFSESGASEIKVPTVQKKPARKPKTSLLKPKIQQENIENSLSKINTEETKKVIDVLDLNVQINKPSPVSSLRRHSIEKFPITSLDTVEAVPSFFSSLPRRSLSPKAKRTSKSRLSIDSKRSSPYTTRSETPTRILRNGRTRKLKSTNLLEGVDHAEYKRRKRLCSELSGSEMSKNSGYESDSSFSDLASLHGIENTENPDPAKELSDSLKNIVDNLIVDDVKTEADLHVNGVDTNSNVCPSIESVQMKETAIEQKPDDTACSPSLKVPEKSLILDSMKLTFNETVAEEKEPVKILEESTADSTLNNTNISTQNVSMEVDNTSVETLEELVVREDEKSSEQLFEDKENVENVMIAIVEEPKKLEDILMEENEAITINNGVVPEEPTELGTSKVEDEVPIYENSLVSRVVIEETPEELAIKEDIMNALGLQSLRAAAEAKLKKSKVISKSDSYTGTLKTVIKLNRNEKKKGRAGKITLQKKKTAKETVESDNKTEEDYKVPREMSSSSWKAGKESSESAGALRKSHYSNRSNMDASSEHTSDGDTGPAEEGTKLLVIPEKASSFSIHPDRLCKDECTYCFGKFGLFDTPCHIATLKSVERQDRILAAEKHLQRDSCLCDACFRHVDRKANSPSYANRSIKRNSLVAPTPKENHCHVLNCGEVATSILRRKWIMKMRKSICQVINIDLNNPGLHSIPVCDTHYQALEHLMICAMCKKKLARNHIHYLGPEVSDLNIVLNNLKVPVTLTDKPVVCKFCRFFATIALKDSDDMDDSCVNYFTQYKKRLLHYHEIELMNPDEVEQPLPIPVMREKVDREQLKRRKRSREKPDEAAEPQDFESKENYDKKSKGESRSQSPSDYMVDYNTLIPKIAMDCAESDSDATKKVPKMQSLILKKIPKPETVKEAVEISKNIKLKQRSDMAVQKLGSNPSLSVRQLFPGEEELPLQGYVDFANAKEKTAEGWEKCTTTIQYDNDTKYLWQELQKPYGNQSSFLRHLILLEKYFRNGDLILSPSASHHSVNYSESVQNRLRAYDNIPSNIPPANPPVVAPVHKQKLSGIIANKETTVVLTNAVNVPKSTPITLSQVANPNTKKSTSLPPGLMPLLPGTTRPITSLVKVPQPQKIKFPVTKNWRPNLIPIDPTKKMEKRPGLVQVISGGKPYHITIEDYKKMCAIKRTFDLRQQRLQEQKMAQAVPTNANSVLKPRKGLIISKTSTVTSPKAEEEHSESILEKLDKQVEKLTEKSPSLLLPKIPKSLTVIPQSVPKKSSSPVLSGKSAKTNKS